MGNKMSQDRYSKMLQMKLDGKSYRKIGESVGVSGQRAVQILAPPKHIKDLLKARAGSKCQDCGIDLPTHGHVHHVQSVGMSEDDYSDVENLRYLCMTCHRIAHLGAGGRVDGEVLFSLRVTKRQQRILKSMSLQGGQSVSEIVRAGIEHEIDRRKELKGKV